jgi:hypothetical protein
MPLQFVDGRFVSWIKHPQKETQERESSHKQTRLAVDEQTK